MFGIVFGCSCRASKRSSPSRRLSSSWYFVFVLRSVLFPDVRGPCEDELNSDKRITYFAFLLHRLIFRVPWRKVSWFLLLDTLLYSSRTRVSRSSLPQRWPTMDSENQEPQSEPSKSDGLMDIASSLRTAALLSRKRRRVVHKTPPTLQLGIQLDYGQWDSASPSAQLSHPDSNQAPPANASPLNQAPDLEDGQREEGEISDTEESPPERKTQMLPAKDSPRARMVSPPIPELPLELDYPSQRSSPPESVTARTASPGATEDSWQSAGLHVSYSPFVVVTPTYRLDANHVRPQLASSCDFFFLSLTTANAL